MKLSDTQKLVIRLMQACLPMYTNDGYRVQTSRGGSYIKVRTATIYALRKLGLLKGQQLTDRGKEVEL